MANVSFKIQPMPDPFAKAKRSEIMAAVKSTNNKLTELKLVTIFRRYGVKGWRRHLPLRGKPDFAFPLHRVIVFVDGCFWHGCPMHLRIPVTNRSYWEQKISKNVLRDRTTNHYLKKKRWIVLRVWEHDLRHESRVISRILNVLNKAK